MRAAIFAAAPLRIAMVSTPFVRVPPESYGGTELVVAELCAALERGGHRVTLFATGDSRGASEVRGLFPRPQWPPSPEIEWSHAAFAARELVAAPGRFDVVHAHCVAFVGLARLCGLPIVYTVHHEREASFSRCYQDAPEIRYVAISHSQRRRESPLPRIEVIHHGLDPARYALGRGEGGHALFMGRFSACKGAHVAIDAARAAGVPICVAAGVHEEDYFHREVEPRLGLPGVEYVGLAGGWRKLALLAGARALLFPVRWEEPFGLVMIEAMLSGTPVIAFGRGSVPEVVEEGVTGWIVDSAEEMAVRLRAAKDFDRVRCRARAVERWSASVMAARYVGAYRRAIREARVAEGLQRDMRS